MSAAYVPCPQSGGQSVSGVITLQEGIVLIFEGNEDGYWTEDLFTSDGHGVVDAGIDCRRDEIALYLWTALATSPGLCALLACY